MLRLFALTPFWALLCICAHANPPAAGNLTTLRQEAALDPATQPRIDAVKAESGKTFDGFGTIQVLRPDGYVDLENSSFDGVPKETRPLAPAEAPNADEDAAPPVTAIERGAAAPAGEKAEQAVDTDADSYHFEGKPTKIPNLILYTAKADEAGGDNSTREPEKPFWQKALKPALLVGGAAATIGGIFFPPLLFLGGFLLGAYATIKVLEKLAGAA